MFVPAVVNFLSITQLSVLELFAFDEFRFVNGCSLYHKESPLSPRSAMTLTLVLSCILDIDINEY